MVKSALRSAMRFARVTRSRRAGTPAEPAARVRLMSPDVNRVDPNQVAMKMMWTKRSA